MIKWLQFFLKQLWEQKAHREIEGTVHSAGQHKPALPAVHFNSMVILDKTPRNDAVGKKDFIVVINQNKSFWTLFQCPCGCGKIISLSLQKIHSPHWTVRKSSSGRPTLHPSIWQNQDCCSHFWIKDGRVYWCNNTGIEPWVAEPRYYSKWSRLDKYV